MGMSLYGANVLARKELSAATILSYYYPGTETKDALSAATPEGEPTTESSAAAAPAGETTTESSAAAAPAGETTTKSVAAAAPAGTSQKEQ